MGRESPLVSVIVRTKDRPKLLKRAIQSIASQTYRPVEVVLVNDGGCDLDIKNLEKTLGDISLNYIRLEKNMGRAHAGNLGMENAGGKYIGFLDDDDEFHADHLLTLVSFLEQSDYAVAYTDSLMIYKEYNPETNELNNDLKKEVVFSQDFNYDKLVFENYIPFMCLLFNKAPLVSSGGFAADCDLYEDWDLLIRIGKTHPFYHIRQVTADYNQWSVDFQISQLNRDPLFLRESYLKVLSRHMDKVTPARIHDYMSGYVRTRNLLKEAHNESDLYKDMIAERDSRIDRMAAELELKGPQVEELSMQLHEKDSQINNLAAELEGKTMQINDLAAELEGKTMQINDFAAELEGKTMQINDLAAEVEGKTMQINDFAAEVEGKTMQINNLAAELQEKDAHIDLLVSELKERGVLESLVGELRERGLQLENLYAELREKGPRVEKLYNELRERDAQIGNLYAELKEKGPQVEKLYGELRERDAQIGNLCAELKEKGPQVEKLYGELRERDAQIGNLYAELKEKGLQLDDILGKLKETETQADNLTSELRDRYSQTEALIHQVRERASQVEILTADLRGKDAQLLILNDIIKERERLITAMKNTRGWKVLERFRKIRDRIRGPEKRLPLRSAEPPIPKADRKPLPDQSSEKAHAVGNPDFSAFSPEATVKPVASKVSVIIPTKNAGDEFDYTLRRITGQEGIGEIELVIVDSGSKDNTLKLCKDYTQNIFHVAPEEFHHARTRNLGAEKATGEYLVFTVQDAIPVGNQWLYKLIQPIHQGKAAAVSARQIPRADADLFASWAMWVHTGYMGYDHDRITSNAVFRNFDGLDMQGKRAAASLDSVCLGIKKSTFDKYLFCSGYAEDFDLGIRLLKDNHTLLFQSSNSIIHSHNRSAMYFLKRGYIDTVYLWNLLRNERKNIPVEPVLETFSYLYAVVKVCISALRVECELGKEPVFLVYSFLNNLEKKINGFSPACQQVDGDADLDDFFKNIAPRNHQYIATDFFSVLKESLHSLSDYLKCFQTVDDVKEDFLNSIYKLFSNTAGYYLGANTQGDIDSLSRGV